MELLYPWSCFISKSFITSFPLKGHLNFARLGLMLSSIIIWQTSRKTGQSEEKTLRFCLPFSIFFCRPLLSCWPKKQQNILSHLYWFLHSLILYSFTCFKFFFSLVLFHDKRWCIYIYWFSGSVINKKTMLVETARQAVLHSLSGGILLL